jgi:beta-glucosidase-like glycosyl hydrolase/CubicO group peptidase (beta-lactamase class C family)
MRRFFAALACLSLLFSIPAFSQKDLFPHTKSTWVDSVMASLSVDQKIGQVLMPRGNSNPIYDTTRLFDIVRNYHVGGFVLFAGYPTTQARLVNKLQAMSKVPLFIGMDLEWGLNMRLDSTVRYPYQMTLGAMQGNDALIEKMGFQIAQQCKRMGVHINYAPVVDVNNNPNNPVINFRSFGEDRNQVTQKSLAYMRGLQKGGIITSAKHFPGHGDTGVDSHYDIPVLTHNRARLDSLELFPYAELIDKGLQGVMVGHLSIPSLDSTANLASTMSKPIVTGLLRDQLKFQGLVFTDAMDMKGATKMFPEGQANVKAFLAGNDILETFVDVPAAFNAIKKALTDGEITEAELDLRVRRILNAKAWAGLDQYQPTQIKQLIEDLNPINAEILKRTLAEKTVTVLKNPKGLIPIRQLDSLKIATLAIGKANYGSVFPTEFQKMAQNYMEMDHYYLDENSADSTITRVENALKNVDVVLVGLHGISYRPANNYAIKPKIQALVSRFATEKAIYTHFANPFTFKSFENLNKTAGLVLTYQDGIAQQEAAAMAIFGGIAAEGKLPVSASAEYPAGMGVMTPSLGRLQYQVIPEAVGLSSQFLNRKVDSLAQKAIDIKGAPGAVVLIAKEGKVIYHKAFGTQTYESKDPMKTSDIFDLASITKISTSVPALMKWQDEGKFSVQTTMGSLIPGFDTSNKSDLKYLDILTHQARLRAWIPFWQDYVDSTNMILHSKKYRKQFDADAFVNKYVLKSNAAERLKRIKQNQKVMWDTCVDLKNEVTRWKPRTLSYAVSEEYPMQVAPNLWAHRSMGAMITEAIKGSALRDKKEYVYSDLSYYLLPQISTRMTGKTWTNYLSDTFYKPLGAKTLVYQAEKYFPLARIVPTEYDSLFRKTLIHGKVHDEGAALLDGISGHAGLFGNANDLAKLMQMYLQKGYYGGKQFIDEKTVKQWTSYPFSMEENARRGIGFDKPDRKKPGISAAESASQESFGHSGFTGTYTWVDPVHDIVYVFLSNRVYPTRNNSRISDANIRTGINEVIYQAIKKGN